MHTDKGMACMNRRGQRAPREVVHASRGGRSIYTDRSGLFTPADKKGCSCGFANFFSFELEKNEKKETGSI